MIPVDAQARRRWMAIVGVRMMGIAGAVFGLVLVSRAPTLAPRILGIAIVLSALLVVAIVPASLAQRWRSGGE